MSQSSRSLRQVAYRTFSQECNRATYTFRESDEEQAPMFSLLPTGAAANRVFAVGTLTDAEDIGDDAEYWRGQIVDPVGTFFVYASQYQPDALEQLKEADTPCYMAVTGKPRTYETDDGGMNVSIRPEVLAIVDEATRERWIVETADRTLARIEEFDPAMNEYARMAMEQYEFSIGEFVDMTIQALESLDS